MIILWTNIHPLQLKLIQRQQWILLHKVLMAFVSVYNCPQSALSVSDSVLDLFFSHSDFCRCSRCSPSCSSLADLQKKSWWVFRFTPLQQLKTVQMSKQTHHVQTVSIIETCGLYEILKQKFIPAEKSWNVNINELSSQQSFLLFILMLQQNLIVEKA